MDAVTERLPLAHIIYDLGLGGAERQLYELCSRLPQDRYELHVICFHGGGAYIPRLQEAAAQVHVVEKHGLFDMRFLFALAAKLREIAPALVHTWMLSANLWGRLALDMAQIRPVVVAAERKTFVNEPWARRAIVGWLGSRSDAVIGNSRDVVENQIADGVPREQAYVIENGIDFTRFDTAPERSAALTAEGLDPALPLVLTIGRLHPQKDQRTFIAAAGQLLESGRRAQFAIVGDGELRGQLAAQIAASGHSAAIHLLKSRPGVEGLIANCDVFCLPSLTEGFPNVLAEAMGCGRACIATRVSGSVDMIRDGMTGYLIDVGNADALANRIARYLDDSGLAKLHGERARQYIRANNSVEAMVRRYDELYTSLLARRT